MKSVEAILIVDDDLDDISFLVECIKTRYTGLCLPFTGGKELMAYLELTRILPKLIVLDVNMPVKDGFCILAELKADENLRTVPVIMFSTSEHPRDIERCYQLGCHKFYTKPSSVSGYGAIADEILADIARLR